MKKIAIIDYGLGNLFSVVQAFKRFDCDAVVITDPAKLNQFDGLVLPGVGAFGKAMEDLKSRGFDLAIRKWVEAEKPFLGICLGMHLLMDYSEEFGRHPGLGLIPGHVQKFPEVLNGQKIRIPRMGWSVLMASKDHPALARVQKEADMYYVHSFHVVLKDSQDELASSDYHGLRYTSAIAHKNIWAYQFHPEKSGVEGLKLLENWKSQI